MLLLEMDTKEKKKRVEAAMERERYSWREFGRRVGRNYATLQAWIFDEPKNQKEEERRNELLARIGLSPDFEPVAPQPNFRVAPMEKEEVPHLIPILGNVSAGPLRLVERHEAVEWTDGDRADKGHFAVRIEGSSMFPAYKSGDTVFCRSVDVRLEPHEDCNFPFVDVEKVRRFDGEDCIVCLNDEVTFKRIKIETGEGGRYKLWLMPLNPDFQPVAVRMGDVFRIQAVQYKMVRRR